MILESILAALLPAGIEAVKSVAGGLGRRWGGLSVDDEIKLDAAQVSKLQALATLDTPGGTPSQWVVDLRASFRYIAAGVCILGGTCLFFVNPLLSELAGSLVSMPFSFIFGERMMLSLKGKK